MLIEAPEVTIQVRNFQRQSLVILVRIPAFYMAVMYGRYLWQLCMAVMYGSYVWQLYMVVIYGSYVWQLCMAVMYGSYVRQIFMTDIYGTKMAVMYNIIL